MGIARMSSKVRNAVTAVVALAVYTLLVLHVNSLTSHVHRARHAQVTHSLRERSISRFDRPAGVEAGAERDYPAIFVYRRSRKTGSTSMANALITPLSAYGYVAPVEQWDALQATVRNEFVRPSPRKLMLLYHNRITRAYHPRRDAVIADTFRDGFAQVTSQCRHMGKVDTCDDAVVECMAAPSTRRLLQYRYAGGEEEDADTYVDLPLSSLYPALSTSVLRTVFPDIVLNVDAHNIRDSACNETAALRAVYNKYYSDLDRQNVVLKRRMLAIAGYPIEVSGRERKSFSLDDMLAAAEQKERGKYGGMQERPVLREEHTVEFQQFRNASMQWFVDAVGKLHALDKGSAKDYLRKMEEDAAR